MAAIPPPATSADTVPSQTAEISFHGRASEYFRIWAVNLCLTLLTLGVYSAWAKVRKKRYFYSHLTLDGTPFQYLGQPIPILKGRIVALLLFVLYYLSSNFFLSLFPYVLAAGVLLAPWVVVRSAAFNARYSAFRNMTFEFVGGYRDAARALYWLGLIPAIAVGTIFDWWGNLHLAVAIYTVFVVTFPWWLRRLKSLIVDHTRFGGELGELSISGGQLFRIYFVAGLIMTAVVAVAGSAAAALISTGGVTDHDIYFVSLLMYAGYVFAYAFVQARSSNLVWNHTRIGPARFQSTLRGRDLAKLYLTNALGILMSAGLLIPWAVIRTMKYRADHLDAAVEGSLADFHGASRTAVQAAGAELGEFFDLDLSL